MMKNNLLCRVVNLIDKHPIALNVAFKPSFQFTVKRVIIALRRQGLLVDDHVQYFGKLIEIPTTLSHQFAFFPERLCVNRLKHGLLVQVVVGIVPVKVF